ncbi:bifunctional diaminohydroxyphosphoribosylaminopyrimidine deaminase/5-amino-6-(5-phosphoribosylamino)uracil reductase RibD [Paenibacillus sp. GXUN7292]|uniref:bifunctional diaminohydroxyphosphoribosylaminopyrimidine deaminase/5-amino-6-(5-phosphoribosylamino)uracil reductase RibD n=1 Tax=Paenibacillus sp. GXUN7292 TaxID=3422499 RepID=UPI003D7EAA41
MDVLSDEHYMRIALELAAAASGQTGTNPVVGCVVVNEGRVVGMGAHLKQGEAHAEVHALQMAGELARNATVYVTLEPCSHYGSTPPCSDRIIDAGAAKVVIASLDPNPLVAGSGAAKLRARGIEVVEGVMQREAQLLNEKFNHYITTGLPFVTIKTASTLDGKIASQSGDSRWITGEKARAEVHTLRHQHEAIMVGVDTVIADDPSLTTRAVVPALHPVRIVVDSSLRIPLEAKLLSDQLAPVIVLTTSRANQEKLAGLTEKGVQVISCGEGPKVDLAVAMKKLGELKISSILLEGGGKLNGAMLRAALVNKIIMYYGTKIIGGFHSPSCFAFEGIERMSDAIELDNVAVSMAGNDICVVGYPVYQAERR